MSEIEIAWRNVKHAALRATMTNTPGVMDLASAYERYIEAVTAKDPKAGEIQVMILKESRTLSIKRKDLPGYLRGHPDVAKELIKAWAT